MVEAALAPLHIKGGSPCEYPHNIPDLGESMNSLILDIHSPSHGLKARESYHWN
jgi:hypothetical protein